MVRDKDVVFTISRAADGHYYANKESWYENDDLGGVIEVSEFKRRKNVNFRYDSY